MGTVMEPVPVTGLAENFSPIPRIAPPPLGSEMAGERAGFFVVADSLFLSPVVPWVLSMAASTFGCLAPRFYACLSAVEMRLQGPQPLIDPARDVGVNVSSVRVLDISG